MAAGLTTVAFKDGAGTTVTGGLTQLDKSGVGTGPNVAAHVVVDGAAGVNRQTVDTHGSGQTTLVDSSGNAVTFNANGQASAANSAPVVLNNDSGYSAAITVTRPANVTAYTANDVVGGAITFTSMGPSAGRVIITSAALEYDVAAIPSGMTSYRLYLYNVTPPSATADNGAWDLPSGDRASFLGYIDLGSPADLGSTLYCETNGVNKQIKLSGTSIFGYLVTNGGFTPAGNSETLVVTLHATAA